MTTTISFIPEIAIAINGNEIFNSLLLDGLDEFKDINADDGLKLNLQFSFDGEIRCIECNVKILVYGIYYISHVNWFPMMPIGAEVL